MLPVLDGFTYLSILQLYRYFVIHHGLKAPVVIVGVVKLALRLYLLDSLLVPQLTDHRYVAGIDD